MAPAFECGAGRPLQRTASARGAISAGLNRIPEGQRRAVLEALDRERGYLRSSRAASWGKQVPDLVLLGRVVPADPAADPTDVVGQMEVHPGGWFVTSIASRALPLWFSLHAHEPVKVRLSVPDAGEFDVGDIALPRVTKARAARLTVEVTLERPDSKVVPELRLAVQPCGPPNTPNGGSSDFRRPLTIRLGRPRVVVEDFSWATYELTVAAEGHVSLREEVAFKEPSSEQRRYRLERAEVLEVEYVVGTQVELQTVPALTARVGGGAWWTPVPHGGIEIGQRERTFHFDRAAVGWDVVALGHGPLQPFRSRLTTQGLAPLGGEIVLGEVYLLHNHALGQWMLARFRRASR